MLFYRRVVPITVAEDHAKKMMKGFDALPRPVRNALNAAPEWPDKAGVSVARFGPIEAANHIIRAHWGDVFKTRDRKGVHP